MVDFANHGTPLPRRSLVNVLGANLLASDNGTNTVLTSVNSSHVFNVLDPQFGADPTGGTDSSTAIQAAINAAASCGGGRVYFPRSTPAGEGAIYAIAKTLHVGNVGTPVSGIVLEAEGRSLGQAQAILRWIGELGGTMLEIRAAHSCAYKYLGFDGGGLANYCVHMHYVSSDSDSSDGLQVEHHIFEGCYFASALIYNELIGEPDGNPSCGDVSEVTHINCYYQQDIPPPDTPKDTPPVPTTAHVRHRSINALNNIWVNCQFYGNSTTGYPSHAVSNGGGRIALYDPVYDVIGGKSGSDLYITNDWDITNDRGIAPGSIHEFGGEHQSHKVLVTSTDGTYGVRSTILEGTYHNDLLAGNDPDSISWDIPGAALIVTGGNYTRNTAPAGSTTSGGSIRVMRPTCSLVANGPAFGSGAGFEGYIERVSGNYRDANGNNQAILSQYETSVATPQRNTSAGAVVIGSGASFSTLTNGEYFYLTLNGTNQQKITFTVPGDTNVTAVLNTINTVMESAGVNGYPTNVDPPTGTQLCFRATQSITITAGSSGTLAKLGLTAGTTKAMGALPVAGMMGPYTPLAATGDTVQIGNYEWMGALVVAYDVGIGTGGAACMFQLQGGSKTVIKEWADTAGQFSTTKNNPSTVNVYWDNSAGMYTVQNNLANGVQVSLSFMGIMQQ